MTAERPSGKIVPLMKRNVSLPDGRTWVKPLVGSDVVGFGTASEAALFIARREPTLTLHCSRYR